MNIIEAYNINYLDIFHNLDINIKEGEFVNIVGKNNIGKSTLIKLLSGELLTDKLDGIQLNKFNIEEVNKKVGFINSYNEFFSKTVIEEILQCNNNISVFDINRVKRKLEEFNLLDIKDVSSQDLSYAENQIVALIKVLIKNPRIIFLDNAFSKLDIDKRRELFSYIREYAKKNNITIISITNNLEDLFFDSRVILLTDSGIKYDGDVSTFFDEINVLKEGLNIPWILDVSNKLKLYNLIDKTCFSIDELVGELCK